MLFTPYLEDKGRHCFTKDAGLRVEVVLWLKFEFA